MGWTWWALGNRPAVFPVAACLLGVTFGPRLEWPWWTWLSLSALVLGAAWRRAGRVGSVLLGLLGAAALGAGLAELGLDVPHPPLARRVQVDGTIEAVRPEGLVLETIAVEGEPMRFRAALSGEPKGLVPGQRVLLEARFKPLSEAANPGEWSRAEWAWRRGQPVGGAFSAARVIQLSAPPRWRRWLTDEHELLARDTRAQSSDPDAAAFLLTLSSGARAELGEALEDSFSRSGLAHVLSVSGLHVAVLAFSLFAALRWLLSRRMRSWLRRVEPRAFAGVLSLPFVWGYVVFTGWQAPAVRSGVMSSLVLCAWSLRRRSDPLNALAVAALGMLAVDPAAPFELSVQLSFCAVLALVLLAPSVRRAIPVEPPSPATTTGWRLHAQRWREAVLQTFSASVAVTAATGPLVLLAFQRVSLAGLVSNVVTLPLSGVLTLVAAGGAAVHVVSPFAATPLLWCGVQLSRLFVFIAERFAAAPGASVALPAAPAALMALWWLGLALLVLARGRWRALALVAPAALALHLVGPREEGGLRVTFLAVGHGDAVVLSSQGQHALIDGGGVPEGHDTGQRFVLPWLRHERIERLELAALTHAHPDHALGLISVLEEVPTKRLWLHAEPGEGPLVNDLLAATAGAEVEEKEAGDEGLTLGEARLEVLGPPADQSMLEGENDRSLVLLVRHREVTVLLTGDVEAAAEASLAPGAVTVMKAPHHGSDTSSTPEFVARTRPKHVVFCVGRRNRFDFPRADVVRRWREVGAQCHRTDVDGAITFVSDGHDVRVEKFAPRPERQARAWRRRPE